MRSNRFFFALFCLWLILLHGLLILSIVKPYFWVDQQWRFRNAPSEPVRSAVELQRVFRTIDANAEAGRLVLIGDSHFQQMDVGGFNHAVLNYSAGQDTLRHMAERVRQYPNLGKADAVIIWGGFNDLFYRPPSEIAPDMGELLSAIPKGPKIYVWTIAPIGRDLPNGSKNKDIGALNKLYSAYCTARCQLVDVNKILSGNDGYLGDDYDSGDHVHLNANGYRAALTAFEEAKNSK